MAFGEILKQARLEKGWTKEQVAERLHMMVRTIDILESENIKKIPAPIYGRGFIRQYSSLFKMDPAPLLADYEALIGNGPRSRTVTHPDIKGPPAQPLEPIHTGAHRTLPPREPLPENPAPITSHKLVEPAEETFTSVPKPEVAPVVVTETPAAEPDLFSMAATASRTSAAPETTPQQSAPVSRELPPPTHPHRAIFSNAFEKEKRGRTIVPSTDRSSELRSTNEGQRRIFGPQQPAKTPKPEKPQTEAKPVRNIVKGISEGCTEIVSRATHPKVERLTGDEGRYVTPHMLYQALFIFLGLLALTGTILLFRYVFQLSDAAQPDSEIAAQVETGPFKPRPVATPPEAFLE